MIVYIIFPYFIIGVCAYNITWYYTADADTTTGATAAVLLQTNSTASEFYANIAGKMCEKK